MSTDERTRIESLLKEGKISIEESRELMDALEPKVSELPVPPVAFRGGNVSIPLPLFLLVEAALIVFGWTFTFVMPRYVEMFHSSDIALPFLTMKVLSIGDLGALFSGSLFVPAILWGGAYLILRRMPRSAFIWLSCLLLLGLLVLGGLTLLGLALPQVAMTEKTEGS